MKKTKESYRKKLLLIVFIALIAFALLIFGKKTIKLFNAKQAELKNNEFVETLTAEETQVGEHAYISSMKVIDKVTGTAPFDKEEGPGNDTSDKNNIVRSFDTMSWNVECNLSLKDGEQDEDARRSRRLC